MISAEDISRKELAMKVIVVEDEDRIREGILGLLEMMDGGYEAAGEAENGEIGLELIRKEQPDIVITDVRMPDMSGLEMLSKMKEEGIASKVIVLSAYSEFEYARTAMKMGVTEYLLKPVSVDEFSRAMNAVKVQIEKERCTQPDTLGTLEQVMGAVLYGQLEPDVSMEEYLKNRYGIDAEQDLVQLCVYLGNDYTDKADRVEKEWRSLLNLDGIQKFCIIRADYEQSLLIIIYQLQNLKELERRIQYLLLQGQGSAGWIVSKGLADLKNNFELIYSYMDWNLTLGKDVLIAYPKILQIRTAVCTYPIELENRLKTEICQGNFQQIQKVIESFHAYFSGGKLYMPKDMKECYIRFIWAAINIAKEVDMLDYGNLNQQSILDHVMEAKLFTELKETLDNLIGQIRARGGNDEAIDHLTVRRVKSMIHEFYQSGITLDEIALKLNVTPEYLSMQFHKVVGETYSSYLKNYRINKAKELLLGTQKRQYEIAKEVGYTDSKYFSRIFRECTGYSPVEYRKTHK